MKLTRETIYSIAPMAKAAYVDDLLRYWKPLSSKYGVTSSDHTAKFLGQIMVETQGMTRLEENLYYTTEARLRAVWPSRFKSNAAAKPYTRNPRSLANLVYGGRLGNTAPDDGYKYRGSGTPHLTGKANYAMVQRETGQAVVEHPDRVRSFPMALEAGMVFWKVNNLHLKTTVEALTKAWQGGTGGLKDRITYTNRATKALAGLSTGVVPTKPAAVILRNGGPYSEAVRTLQLDLKAKGYDPGLIDGFFGDATERAVQEFQTRAGLVADGVAGPATLNALAEAKVSGDYKNKDDRSGLRKFLDWLESLFNRA